MEEPVVTEVSQYATQLSTCIEQVEQAIRDSLPDTYEVKGYADSLAAELLMTAVRNSASIRALMDLTIEGPIDHTESAAALVRNLFEIWALLVWIAEQGEDPEVQAIRVELTDSYQQRTAAREVAELYGEGAKDPRLDELEDVIAKLKTELGDRGADVQTRDSTFDILKRKHPDYSLRWRFESSVTHTGSIGRALQRENGGLGAPASWERRVNILSLTVGLYGGIAERAFKLMGRSTDDLAKLAGKQQELIDQAHAEAGITRPQPSL
jgi:hypothetical protein